MTIVSIALLIIGATLLCAEFFIPGFGICGITGTISILISAVLTIIFVPYGLFVLLWEIVMLAIVIFAMFRYIKKRQLYGKLILDETLNYEKRELVGQDSFLGKEGISKTPLKPFGTVDFDGITMEVWSDGNYISENKTVKVIKVLKSKIIVKQTGQ